MFYSSNPRKSLSFPSTGGTSFPIIHLPCQLCSIPQPQGSPYLFHPQESLLSLSSTYPANCVLFLNPKEDLIFPIHRSHFFPYHPLTLPVVLYSSTPRKYLSFPSIAVTSFPIIHLPCQLWCNPTIQSSSFPSTRVFLSVSSIKKMNFSQVVRGQLNPSQAIIAIKSQAETELRRSLSKEEEAFLFTNFPPNILLEQIQKVIKNDDEKNIDR